ncbi:unnamed protein product [Adineta steineri]|uniref:G-protein coupled receptors family 1 profile domain-containing protein n=1 Tax=Adineta steineri TaxID=433720 RepID=A0A819AUJ3_9BILA|nr:unnamed protein product [Adineta steineri]CAF3793287.1 unnamed protein product [Adineta steineri]
MSSTDIQRIELLIRISNQISRYFSIFIFFGGTIGNIFNIIILSDRSIRKLPSVFLFLIASIASLIAIHLGLITRMLSGWASDPTYTIGWLCKLRTFLVFVSRAVVFWLFVLATIDRLLLSSSENRQRRLSTMKNAQRGALFVIIMSIIIYAQLFYCYEANLTNAPFQCYAKSSSCQLLTDMTFASFTTIVPLLLMLIFGLMTISNIRESHRRLCQTSIETMTHRLSPSQQRSKKMERHLLFMVFTQVLVLAILTLPQAIQRLYAAFIGPYNSQLQATKDMFVYNIVLLLTYLASAMPFYIYTLTGGTLFRKPLLNLMQRIYRLISCRRF